MDEHQQGEPTEAAYRKRSPVTMCSCLLRIRSYIFSCVGFRSHVPGGHPLREHLSSFNSIVGGLRQRHLWFLGGPWKGGFLWTSWRFHKLHRAQAIGSTCTVDAYFRPCLCTCYCHPEFRYPLTGAILLNRIIVELLLGRATFTPCISSLCLTISTILMRALNRWSAFGRISKKK